MNDNITKLGIVLVLLGALGFSIYGFTRPSPPRPVCTLQYKAGTKATVIDGDFSGERGVITAADYDRCGYIVMIKNPKFYQGQSSPFVKKGNVIKAEL